VDPASTRNKCRLITSRSIDLIVGTSATGNANWPSRYLTIAMRRVYPLRASHGRQR